MGMSKAMARSRVWVLFFFALSTSGMAAIYEPGVPSLSTPDLGTQLTSPGRALDFGEFLSADSTTDPIIVKYLGGEKTEAKRLLAARLQADQRDVDALDIAGSIYLWEQRLNEAQVALEAALAIEGPNKRPDLLAKLGVVRLLAGDHDKAVRMLRFVHRIKPDNRIALRYLAWYSQRLGDYAVAAAFNRQLRDISHNEAERLNLLATELFLLKRAEQFDQLIATAQDALPDIDRLPIDNESRASIAGSLAEAYIETGQFDKARAALGRLEASGNIQPYAVKRLGVLLTAADKGAVLAESRVAGGDFSEAEEIALKYQLALRYARVEGKPVEAERLLRAILPIAERNGDMGTVQVLLSDLSGVLNTQDLKQEALGLLSTYAERYPDNDTIVYSLAELQVLAGRKQAAQATLDSLLAKTGDHVRALLLDARLARGREDYARAQAQLDKALGLAPGDLDAWVQRAGIEQDQGRGQRAAQVLNAALQQNPGEPSLLFELGDLYYANGQLEAAVLQYEVLLARYPGYLPALDNLATVYLDQGTVDKAKAYAQQTYELAPEDPLVAAQWGRALFANGEPQKGLELMRGALQAADDKSLVAYHLGRALWAQDPQQAREVLTLARPDDLSPYQARWIAERLGR